MLCLPQIRYNQLFYYRGWGWLLPLTALFCGLMYQTRPASVFGFVIVGIMIMAGLIYDWRRYISGAVAAIMLIALTGAGPAIYMRYKTDFKVSSPMLSLSKIGFALQIVEPEDIKYIKGYR